MALELEIGSTFAGHRIEALAGRGGMGVVYRATDLALHRQVALKLIAPALAVDPVFRERFAHRVPQRRGDRPSARRPGLPRGRGERRAVRDDALRRGHRPRRGDARRGPARARAGGRARRPGRGRARRRARARPRPPRRQADQHPDRAARRRRARVPDRLRAEQAAGRVGGPDQARLRDGHGRLHGARARARRRGRRPLRRLRAGVRALPGALRDRRRSTAARTSRRCGRTCTTRRRRCTRSRPTCRPRSTTSCAARWPRTARTATARRASSRATPPRRCRMGGEARACASSSPRTRCCCAPASSRSCSTPAFDVVAEAGDGEELLAAVRAHRPDVAVTDIRMPPDHSDEGLRAARKIREELPGTGVLVLSQYAEEAYVAELLGETAEGLGYLLKDRVADPAGFADAVRQVGQGGSALDPEVVQQMLSRPRADDPLEALSERERAVLAGMAEGQSNATIARPARRQRAGRRARHLRRLRQARPAAGRRGPPARAGRPHLPARVASSGIRPRTCVPAPGRERISSSPPTAAIRSRMLVKPTPPPSTRAGSKPAPSSRISTFAALRPRTVRRPRRARRARASRCSAAPPGSRSRRRSRSRADSGRRPRRAPWWAGSCAARRSAAPRRARGP